MSKYTALMIAKGELATQDCSSCPIRHRAVCAQCNEEELKQLASMKSYRTWSAGDTIAMEGDSMSCIGSIVSGCATLTKSLEDGRVQMVGLLMPSDFVGRPGRAKVPYEVTAITDTKLCLFDRQKFERLLADTPNVATRLLEMSLGELDAARDWMLLLGRKTARERVATFLSLVMQRAASSVAPLRADLPLGREAIASYLGLTIETVSRQLTALRRDGVIDFDKGGRSVICHDLAVLLTEAGNDSDETFPA